MESNRFEVKMNDGVLRDVTIEGYSAVELADELNNPDKNMIAIGDVVVQRYSVVRITPIETAVVDEDVDDLPLED